MTGPRTVGLAFAVAMAAATLGFFGSFVTDPGAMIFGTDMVSQAYQSRAFAVAEVQAGDGLPRWNPYVYAGLPYLSILPYPVWYPTSLLYFALPLHRAIGWTFVLHFLLAGVLAYALARELELGPGPAIVTGAAYMFTGYLVSHLYAGQDGRMFAMTWTPALFLLAERAVSRRSLHAYGWLAAVVALQLFTPHVQMTYFAAIAVAAYVAFRLIQLGRAGEPTGAIARLAVGFVGAYAVAGLVALVEILPTWSMLQFSHRVDRGYAYAASWAMPVQETLAVVWPRFQGYLGEYAGTNPFKLHTEYLGAVPVLLAGLALAARRTPRTWFFAGLAAVGLVFAWGAATPVHRIATWTLPVMKSFRAPAMMFSVVALAVVVLAGHGAQTLEDRRETLRRPLHPAWIVLGGLGFAWAVAWLWASIAPRGFAGAVTGLLYGGLPDERWSVLARGMPAFADSLGFFAVAWWIGLGIAWAAVRGRVAPLAACALLAAIAVVDLWRVDRDFYGTFPVARLERADPAVRWLREQPGPFRVLPLPGSYGPNDLMLHRIESVTGSQNFRLAWWDDLVGEDLGRLEELRLWRLLNIRYATSGRPIEAAPIELAFDGGPLVYRLVEPGSPAWVVHETRVRAATGEPAEALLDPGLDLSRTALLEPGTEPPPLGRPTRGAAAVRWVEREIDRLVVEVEAPAAGLLVLSEIYHPYWRATLDGEPTPVLQVDVALRGVAVPAGRHRIAMRFADPNLTLGAIGSGVGLAFLVGFLFATGRRRGARPERSD